MEASAAVVHPVLGVEGRTRDVGGAFGRHHERSIRGMAELAPQVRVLEELLWLVAEDPRGLGADEGGALPRGRAWIVDLGVRDRWDLLDEGAVVHRAFGRDLLAHRLSERHAVIPSSNLGEQPLPPTLASNLSPPTSAASTQTGPLPHRPAEGPP